MICPECIHEDYLANHIIKLDGKNTCSYCNNKNAVPLDDIVPLIHQGISRWYEDPTDSVGWCSREGGWIGVDGLLSDISDIIFDHIGCDDDVANDICIAIPQEQWVRRDPYGMTEDDDLFYTWEKFSQIVKHNMRYVFFRSVKISNIHSHTSQELSPFEILDIIGDIIEQCGLIKDIEQGHLLYRARCTHSKTKRFTTAAELGPPPAQHALSSRMSPNGISMFYGASDEETCKNEIVYENNVYITTAKWTTRSKIKAIDFSHGIPVPSIFSSETSRIRPWILFLNKFLHDFSKKIEKDNREHIEYVPTQIVTEFFRHIYHTKDNEKILAIKYKSSRGPGNCYVLFCGQENCTDDIANDSESLLRLDSTSITRRLIKNIYKP